MALNSPEDGFSRLQMMNICMLFAMSDGLAFKFQHLFRANTESRKQHDEH